MASATPDWQFDWADLIGKPFALQGRGPDKFDCFGLYMTLAARAGHPVPDFGSPQVLAEAQRCMVEARPQWTPCDPGPGALVAIRLPGHDDISHVGMVLPAGRFIHVWERSGGVVTESLRNWRHNLGGFYVYTENKND